MTLDEILDEWKNDCRLDEHSLDRESLFISELQNKYMKMLMHERAMLKIMRLDQNKFDGELRSYFRGELNSPEELERIGREPCALRILDKNLDYHMNQDEQFIKRKLNIIRQEEKVDVLDAILESIGKRGYQIKGAIDFMKFKSGY